MMLVTIGYADKKNQSYREEYIPVIKPLIINNINKTRIEQQLGFPIPENILNKLYIKRIKEEIAIDVYETEV
jgi:hypothetical protein